MGTLVTVVLTFFGTKMAESIWNWVHETARTASEKVPLEKKPVKVKVNQGPTDLEIVGMKRTSYGYTAIDNYMDARRHNVSYFRGDSVR